MGLMMTFTPTQKELFNKNIEALSNILLKESLKEIKSSKFELVLGKDNLDINLKDTSIKNNGGGGIMKIYFIKIPL
ncbi:motility associated factor glycosyltransferase family protein, partial [Campylobacter jejuni]|nr:motility associated factor glycosyltransferase family protein [Campylobacter jejuni]